MAGVQRGGRAVRQVRQRVAETNVVHAHAAAGAIARDCRCTRRAQLGSVMREFFVLLTLVERPFRNARLPPGRRATYTRLRAGARPGRAACCHHALARVYAPDASHEADPYAAPTAVSRDLRVASDVAASLRASHAYRFQ